MQQDQTQQLDPSIVNLAKSISQTETNGQKSPYTATGGSGEYGAYQYIAPTWAADSQKYLGQSVPLTSATPAQQDEVAYKKIQDLGKQGYKPNQIASIWNSGKPDPTGNVGTNKEGVAYDTPQYVKSVQKVYEQLQGGQQATPQQTSSTVGATPQSIAAQNQPQQSLGQKILGGVEGLANWAFPIAKDVYNDATGNNTGTQEKSGLQQIGDLGLSALWFVPGIGEVGEGARAADAAVEGGGLLSKVLGSNLAKGGALGYGAGVASNLASGQGLGQAFSPNPANVLGAVTGGLASTILPKVFNKLSGHLSESGAVQGLEDNVNHALNATKSGRGWMQTITSQGGDPAKLIAQSGVAGKISVVDQKLDTSLAQRAIEGGVNEDGVYEQGRIGALGQLRAKALDTIGATVKTDDLRREALAQIPKLGPEVNIGNATNQINSSFDNFKAKYGEVLNPSQVEEIKEGMTNSSGVYKNNGMIDNQNASSLIGNVARSKIEQLSDASGFPGMNEYNDYMKQHYTALSALKRLNGQAVKGGLLGNTLRQHTIGLAAGAISSAMGGGVLKDIGAIFGGEMAGKLISKVMGDTALSNPLRNVILSKLETEDPEIVQKLQQFAQQGKSKVAPLYSPKKTSKMPSLSSGLISKALTRSATGLK